MAVKEVFVAFIRLLADVAASVRPEWSESLHVGTDHAIVFQSSKRVIQSYSLH